jgi:hypothetical protein
MLYHINAFRKLVYSIPIGEGDVQSSTTLALQSVFKNLQFSSSEVTTKDLTAAFGWTSADAFMQQDIQEMLRVLLDKLEEKMKGTPLDGRVQQLFAGKVRSYIQCVHVDFASNREEDFYDIQLDVKGCRTVYDSLKKYVEIEMLDGENQYDADRFGKQDARKGVIFTRFPPVLTMHLKRFDFDYATMGFKKIHDYYEFPSVLDINPYLADDCPPESRAVRNRYLLHSVLVHAGDVGGGHYYAYIRPSTQTNYSQVYSVRDIDALAENQLESGSNEWFKFNDETVLPVDSREAVQYCYGRRTDFQERGTMSSAYMLVYIRAQDAADIMKPIAEQDIPKALVQRLEREKKRKIALERQSVRQRMLCNIKYATEEDFRHFHSYSRTADLVEETSLTTLSVFQDCTLLGLHLRIAKELNVSPRSIRLWRLMHVNHLPSQKASFLRIKSTVSFDEYSKRINQDVAYFVEVNIDEEFHALSNKGSENEEIDPSVEDEEFAELLSPLQQRFNEIIEAAVNENSRYAELSFLPDDPDDEDANGDMNGDSLETNQQEAHGPSSAFYSFDEAKALRRELQNNVVVSMWNLCHIGAGNKIMYEFRDFDLARANELRSVEKEIIVDTIALLKEKVTLPDCSISDAEICEYPVVLKIFDPQLLLGSTELAVSSNSFYRRYFPATENDTSMFDGSYLRTRTFDEGDLPYEIPVSSVLSSPQVVSSASFLPFYQAPLSSSIDEKDTFVIDRCSDNHVMKTIAFHRCGLEWPLQVTHKLFWFYLNHRYDLSKAKIPLEDLHARMNSSEMFVVHSAAGVDKCAMQHAEDSGYRSFADLLRSGDIEGNLILVLSLSESNSPATQAKRLVSEVEGGNSAAKSLDTANKNMEVDPVDSESANLSSRKPFDPKSDTCPRSWLYFQIQKRLVSIVPYSKEDMQILYCLRKHSQQLQCGNLNSKNYYVSSKSPSRKRKRSPSSVSLSSPTDNFHTDSECVVGFETEIPIYAQIEDVLKFIALRLGGLVPVDHLAFGLVPYAIDMPCEAVRQCQFATIHQAGLISEFLHTDRGYDKKVIIRCKRWILLYRILPYSLHRAFHPIHLPTKTEYDSDSESITVQDAVVTDIRTERRLLHYIVSDARLRLWRIVWELYIQSAHNIDENGMNDERKSRCLNDRQSRSAGSNDLHSEDDLHRLRFVELLRQYQQYLVSSSTVGYKAPTTTSTSNGDMQQDAQDEVQMPAYATEEYFSLIDDLIEFFTTRFLSIKQEHGALFSDWWPQLGTSENPYTVFDQQHLYVSLSNQEYKARNGFTAKLSSAMGISDALLYELPYYQQLLQLNAAIRLDSSSGSDLKHHAVTSIEAKEDEMIGVDLDAISPPKATVDAKPKATAAPTEMDQEGTSASTSPFVGTYQTVPANIWLNPSTFGETPAGEATAASIPKDKYPRLMAESEWSAVSYAEARTAVTEKDSNDSRNEPLWMLSPAVPIVTCFIRNNIIERILHPQSWSLATLPSSWLEMSTPLSTLWHMTVQTITPEEWLFIRNVHPTIRSMAMMVIHFTLHGAAVQPLDPVMYSGPVLTYVREDDDYESVVQRIVRIMGDNSPITSSKLRLAVVHPQKFTPDFIPRPANFSTSPTAVTGKLHSTLSLPSLNAVNATNEDTASTNNPGSVPVTASKSIFGRFADVYPEYVQAGATFEQAHIIMSQAMNAQGRRNVTRGFSVPALRTSIPILGIQRSASEIQQQMSVQFGNPLFSHRLERRGQMQQATGIKIV